MQEHRTIRTLWRFIRPEIEEIIAYILATITLFSLAFYHVAIQGKIGADSRDLISTLSDSREAFLSFLSQDDSWGRFFLFGLWFIIGTVVYIIAWAIITLIHDINRDIRVSSSFVHPKSFHQSNYWFAILMRGLLRLTSGIALVFYGVFWIVALAPAWIHTFELVMTTGLTLSSGTEMLLSIVSLVITLHIAFILLRIMLLRAHYSYEE